MTATGGLQGQGCPVQRAHEQLEAAQRDLSQELPSYCLLQRRASPGFCGRFFPGCVPDLQWCSGIQFCWSYR
ncbi:unnamed protein product, partial [Chrysoparadoxa australica]